MKFLTRNKLLALVVLYLIVVLVAIPLTLVTLRKPQDTRTDAETSAALKFSPATVQKNTGEASPLDVLVVPGNHAVSLITLDITYDPTKLSVDAANALTVNTTAFPTILEGPVVEPGRIRVKVAVGYDPTKALTTETKVATVNFTAVGPTSGQEAVVHFGESSFVLSVGTNDSATDNVLAIVEPAQMTITGSPTSGVGSPVDPIPTFTKPIVTPQLTFVPPTNAPGETPTTVPGQPTCTPLPVECQIDETSPICAQIPAGGYCTDEVFPSVTPNNNPLPTGVACLKVEPADIMIVLDISGSMKGDKITNAKESAKNFVRLLKSDPTNKVGLVSFTTQSQLNSSLTGDTDGVENAIDQLKLGSKTCVKCGIDEADNELKSNGRLDARKLAIVLTDGKANVGGDKQVTADQAALNAVKNSKTQGLTVFTIGVGSDVNPAFLQELANISGGQYYFASSPVQINEQFESIYKTVADAVCDPATGGEITATVSIPQSGNIDPVTIIMVFLLFLPLLLLIGNLLV